MGIVIRKIQTFHESGPVGQVEWRASEPLYFENDPGRYAKAWKIKLTQETRQQAAVTARLGVGRYRAGMIGWMLDSNGYWIELERWGDLPADAE